MSKDFLGETIDRDNPLQNKTSVVYLYSKQKENLKSFDKDKIQILKQKIYTHYSNEFDKNYNYCLKEKQYDYDRVQHVLEIAPNIFETEEQYFKLYEQVQNMVKNFSEQLSKYKLFLEQCSNQVSGNETLFVNIVNYYNDLKIQRIEAFKIFSQQREINKNTEQKFDQALNELQGIELHPELQGEGKHFLIDIYFSKDKMVKWKQKCQSFQNYIKKYLEEKNQSIKSIKEVIINNNNKVKNYVKNWIEVEQNLDQKSSQIQRKIQNFLKDFIQLYTQLRDKLTHSIELNPGYNNSLILISNQKKYEEKLEQFKNTFSEIESFLHSFQTDIQNLSNKFVENIEILYQNQKIVFDIDQKLSKIEQEFKTQFYKDVEKMEQDFSSLLKPSLLPQGYQDFIQEIQRRRKVFHELNQIVEKVSETVNSENQNRKKFLTKYGNILPENFLHIIPHLKDNLKCKFVLDLQELEKLPNIDFEKQDDKQNVIEQATKENDSYQELQVLKKLINNCSKQQKKVENQQLQNLKTPQQVKEFLKYFLIENSKFCIKKLQNLFIEQFQKQKKYYEMNIQNLKDELQSSQKNYSQNLQQLQQQVKELNRSLANQQERIEQFEEKESNYEEEITSLKFIIEGLKNDMHTSRLKNQHLKDQDQKQRSQIQQHLYKLEFLKTQIKNYKSSLDKFQIQLLQNLRNNIKDEVLKVQSSQISKRVQKYEQLLENNELEIQLLQKEILQNKQTIKNQKSNHEKEKTQQIQNINIQKIVSFEIQDKQQKFVFLPYGEGIYYNLIPFSNQLIKLDLDSLQNKYKKILQVSNFVIICTCQVDENLAKVIQLDGIFSFDKESVELFNVLDLES